MSIGPISVISFLGQLYLWEFTMKVEADKAFGSTHTQEESPPGFRKRELILSTKPSPGTKKETNLMQQVCFRTIASPPDIEMIFGKMCDV